MSRYTATNTTSTPNTTTHRNSNHTLNQTTPSTRFNEASTKLLSYTRYVDIGSPESEGKSTSDKRILVISGACAAVLILIVTSLVVALIVIRKQRRRRQTTNKNLDKGTTVNREYDNGIMNEIKMTIAKKQETYEEEYDDVVSMNRNDGIYQDDSYDYVHIRANVPRLYNSLGPQDAANIYEEILRNSKVGKASLNEPKYQNYTEYQSKNEKSEEAYKSQEETTKDGYLVPITPKNEVNEIEKYSDVYVKVML